MYLIVDTKYLTKAKIGKELKVLIELKGNIQSYMDRARFINVCADV